MPDYIEYLSDEDFLQVETTPEELDIFLKSVLHKDFQKEVNIRIKMLNDMLTDPGLKYTGRDYDVFRGGMRMAKEVLNLFIDMRDGFINTNKERDDAEK